MQILFPEGSGILHLVSQEPDSQKIGDNHLFGKGSKNTPAEGQDINELKLAFISHMIIVGNWLNSAGKRA